MKVKNIASRLNQYVFALHAKEQQFEIEIKIHEKQNMLGDPEFKLEIILFKGIKVIHYIPSTSYKTRGIAERYKKHVYKELKTYYKDLNYVDVEMERVGA